MVEQMKKNKLFSKIIFFVIVCCGIFSMNAYSCKSNDVKIDYDKSFFNNFKVIEDKVYINCYIVIFNNSSEEKITFKELVKRINKTKILISKFSLKKKKVIGSLKIELINDKENAIEEYNFECFLAYRNNRIYYIK